MSHKPYGVNELREMFLKFFESKNHLRLPSFSLIPQNDASLLLINSGMAPMKPYFKGEVEPPRRRVCTCQKCIRTGDIENIGKTARHGTYFEMLGNFSFGDYFKKESLQWSWEFLTSPEWVGLEADRMYPTVYVDDDEAWDIWTKVIGVPEEHMTRLGKKDNFWEHGAGPCGPCSEIHYDRGIEYGCGKPDCRPGCDCDRFMEVWNNVFSQFDNDGNGNYTELVQKNIDTGMGLERLAVVCQNVNSLFDVDTVMNITNHVTRLTGASYGQSYKTDVSLRVITDHIRASTFMIADGVLPSNEGRGYVLRRLLRRAARHGKLLGVNNPFLYEVVQTVVQENETHYAYLRERCDYIVKIVKIEEENFAKTIDTGMQIFNAKMAEHKAERKTVFSGADAFLLAATYGFPIDLTVEMVEDEGMTVDLDEYNRNREEDKIRAREARKALGDLGWAGVEFGKDVPESKFVGYDALSINDAKVVAMVVEEQQAEELIAGMDAIVVLDKTPFYAEMGGQIGDHGVITTDCGARFEVNDVQKNKGGKYMHYGKLVEGTLKLGETVTADVDADRRSAVMRAHSATHLLDAALRSVLGDHVHQAGSLVMPDRLRFDFTHFSAMTAEELEKVNAIVNGAILSGYEIVTEEMPIEQAKQRGAIALFGEKYGDTVRVVDMGKGFSVEFCGGTHQDNTAKIGPFRIVSEASVASGVRRIEAITGNAFVADAAKTRDMLSKVCAAVKVKNPADLEDKLAAQLEEIKALKKEIEQFKAKEAAGAVDQMLASAKSVGAVKVLTAQLPGADAGKLRQTGDVLRDKDASVVAVLASVNGDKVTFLAVCGKDAVKAGVKAGDIVKHVCTVCGGSGGGKPDSAMGGGKDPSKMAEALNSVVEFVAAKVH